MSLRRRVRRPRAAADGLSNGWMPAVRAAHPPFLVAVAADARVATTRRDERHTFHGRIDLALQVIRLCVVTDAFFAQVCYRGKAACQAAHIPLVPLLLHRLAIVTGQISIGDPVVVEPGVHIPHGQVVVDAFTRVRQGATLSPFTTLGRVVGVMGGPTIGALAEIGTGAKVLGPVTIGARARVGANSVVLSDVPKDVTAVGVPARVTPSSAR